MNTNLRIETKSREQDDVFYELKYIRHGMIDVRETLGKKPKIYVEIYFVPTKSRGMAYVVA